MNWDDVCWVFKFKVRTTLAVLTLILAIYAASFCGMAATAIVISDWTEVLWRKVAGECFFATVFGVFAYGSWQATKQVQWLWFRTTSAKRHWLLQAVFGNLWDH